jgi:hypothetical protein
MTDEIDPKDLPKEGNSNARIYPPADQSEPETREEDPKQPQSGDAAADRGEGPEPNDAM